MTATATFRGTDTEAAALLDALEHNCSCAHDGAGALVKVCEAHRAIVSNQRFLDGLLYVRRVLAARLVREEYDTDEHPHD